MKQGILTLKQRLLIFTLTMLTFIMGTSEFVIVGLLPEIANDIHVTVAISGILVTAFALSYALGTPILTALVSKYPKYPVMLLLIGLFIIANIGSALAHSFTVLLMFRIITAISSGVLISLSMVIASQTMPESKRSGIVATIFAGFAVANVLGVPLGTFIGQIRNWQLSFWVTALLGVIVLSLAVMTIPKYLPYQKSSLKKQLTLLQHKPIVFAFFIPVFGAAGTFTVYTYITPILENRMMIPSQYVGMVLLIFGVFTIFSNMLSGKIARRNGIHRMRYSFLIQAIILACLYLTMNTTVLGLVNVMFVALMFYVMNAPVQLFFMDTAKKYSLAMQDFAASLMPVAINVGIALGSFIGNFIVAHMNLSHLSWVGGMEALIASLICVILVNLTTSKRRYQKIEA